MSDEAGWRMLNWAWDRRDEILRFLSRLRAWFRNENAPEPAPGILILGPGGTGKTTLARLLSGDVNLLLDPPAAYEASIGLERYELSGSPAVEVVVPPGQKHRREATWSDLLADLTAGRYRGLILVAAHGHQSIARDRYQQHPLYAGNKDRFLTALLDRQRTEELEILDQLGPVIRLVRNRLWVLTVVAKQDLWWPNRDEVERYYREGEYHKRLLGENASPLNPNLRSELCSVSLVIQNWVTLAGERLKPNAEGYDHPLQVQSLRRLFETIDALRKWEADG